MSNSTLIRFSVNKLDNKIKTIKLRMCTGYGLKDAKDLIDAGYNLIVRVPDAVFYVHIPFVSAALERSVFNEMPEMREFVEFSEHSDNASLPWGTIGSPTTAQSFDPYASIASNENIIGLVAAVRSARVVAEAANAALEKANANLYELECRLYALGLKVVE